MNLLEAAVAIMVTALSPKLIPIPSGGWSSGQCSCHTYGSLSDQIPTCLVPRIIGVKVQLLCGVRIELA